MARQNTPDDYIYRMGDNDPSNDIISGEKGSDSNLSTGFRVGGMSTDRDNTLMNKAATEGTGNVNLDEGVNYGIMGPQTQQRTAEQVFGNLNDPYIPENAQQQYKALATEEEAPGQFQNETESSRAFMDEQRLSDSSSAAQANTALMGASQVARTEQALIPGDLTAVGFDAAQIGEDIESALMTDYANLSAAEIIQAEAATAPLTEQALMSTQMDELLQGVESGKIPAWAQPAVAAAEAQLRARGVDKSSVGRATMMNAIIQSALPIAQANAQAEYGAWSQNLSNEQQAAMLNAQQGVQVQLSNLSNEQQKLLVNQQTRFSSLLNDQASANAAKQFNAASENQINSFNNQLAAQVGMYNAGQMNTMGQFNAQLSQQADATNVAALNAMTTFDAQIQMQRDTFNSQMYSAIEQSNVQWRRQMNQIDTAGENAVNQANAINAFNLSNQALTLMWQDMRDAAMWVRDDVQSQAERDIRLAIAAMSNETQAKMLDAEGERTTWMAVGNFISKMYGTNTE